MAESAEWLAVKQIFIQEEFDQGNDTSSMCIQRMLTLDKIEREAEIVQSIAHPNIVRFIGCERSGSMYRIFMEFVPAGPISRLLKDLGTFEETTICHFIRQLTRGVAYLHEQGIAHRDLKCANLLLSDSGVVKIADFGTAKRVKSPLDTDDAREPDEFRSEEDTARSVREGLGSPYWMAPEIVRAEHGDDGWRKADIWGIGCVMIEMAMGKPPWENHSNPLTAMFHIASPEAIPPLPQHLSGTAQSFLRACFEKDPRVRPTAAELLEHPFLNGSVVVPPEMARARTAGLAPKVANYQDTERAAFDDHQEPASPAASSSSLASRGSQRSLDSSSNDREDDERGVDVDCSGAYSSDEEGTAPFASHQTAPVTVQELSHPPTARESVSSFPLSIIGHVRAVADYSATEANELSLTEGEVLNVLSANEFGWWRGQRCDTTDGDGASGWFPCTYVEWVSSDEPLVIRRPHEVATTGEYEVLALAVGDQVQIAHCDWRDDCLWAFGSDADGHRGWFPFVCLVEDSK